MSTVGRKVLWVVALGALGCTGEIGSSERRVGDAGPGGEPGGDAAGQPVLEAPQVEAIPANTTVGLDWHRVPGATGYRIYTASEPEVPLTSPLAEVTGTTFVHRGLSNGTTHHYRVVPVAAAGDGPPSDAVQATPGGEWVLEELGSGVFDAVAEDGQVPRVPVAQRVHLLLYAEGYTVDDLAQLHDERQHAGGRSNDVDGWVDEVFGLEPFAFFRDAFVVWFLPRPSNDHLGSEDTAFMVPVNTSGSSLVTSSISSSGETAALAWEALDSFPYPPDDFYAGRSGRSINHVAAFLLFDPSRNRAAVSGRALALTNPDDTSQRLSAGFGVGHAHEFGHAFALLRDEYLRDPADEDGSAAPSSWSDTSNVVGTSVCDELPWSHLLAGTDINPDVQDLVGAFGTEVHGYHPELLCLMNGRHDNANYYGGNGLLRVNDRMCNFCREMTAFRTFERTRVLADDTTAFDTWSATYRSAFYDRYGFVIPDPVPQTNNEGEPHYDPCTP
jgi:hypothetical protein